MKKTEVQVVVADKVFLETFLKTSDSFKIIWFSEEKELYHFGVLKGNDRFIKLVDSTLQAMKSDKTYARIYCKWFRKLPDENLLENSSSPPIDDDPELAKMVKAKSLPSEFQECSEDQEKNRVSDSSYPIYRVQKNDSLWDLAEYHYGNPFHWKHIREANDGKTVLIEGTKAGIREGEILIIPKPPK